MTTSGGQPGPSAVRVDDDSDWWSVTRPTVEDDMTEPQKREIAEASFQILGVPFEDESFAQTFKKLGIATAVDRGDASDSREQVCYVSPGTKGRTYLIFEHGEVNFSLYLFSEDISWNGRGFCVPSPKVSAGLATMSGLHLGQTPEEVIRILGKPSIRRPNELRYDLEFEKATPPAALLRVRQGHPELRRAAFRMTPETFEFSMLISVRFTHSRMTYLGVSSAETE
jgi:hypothetical protein